MLEKTFQPADVERRQYARWEGSGAFGADAEAGRPYTIMMPPPNVTGSLHMGHALTFTLQDALIRYHRMTGRDALWQPGMDHAGIATQMVVERQLEAAGVDRRALGRDGFVERVWEWKQESGGTILNQLRRLGASADWPRERFTMDDGLSHAVRTVFVALHRDGLIYRDKRLVNWDPRLLTAISDLEVESREMRGHLWHLRYPLEDEPGRHIVVATTRPETMLGDTAVAVHPKDERYAKLIGRHVVLPLVGRRIPIVGDLHADPEAGSGAVKITPAHDFNDFEVGRRHDLPMINIFDASATTNDAVPEAYRGLDRYEARKRVVADLEAAGLLEKIEDHLHTVPHGDRSGVAVEPWLTDQWYVDAATLAGPAIRAVEDGRIRFVPKRWENTYFDWMRNIQPWCVSRQLWWGHRVPAWYGPDGVVFVEMDQAEAERAAEAHYGVPTVVTQDEDVLDTWFSSALWPFSTLGWPEETPELKRYYPGDVLVTGFDIIFFWVARMIMMGLKFRGEIPFRDVYIHALVRDASGQKMSKSKGNIMDPLVLIDSYGADAVRFTLAALAAQGRDVKLSESRVEGYRNFATKLWNATRFCEMNECRQPAGFDPADNSATLNRWIVSEAVLAGRAVAKGIEEYRFNDAATAAYEFAWGTFCDWYVELAKPCLGDDADDGLRRETRATAAWVLAEILRLLHPLMPFITEELWQGFGPSGAGLLIREAWPTRDDALIDAGARDEMGWAVRLISAVRSVRSEMNVPASATLALQVTGASADTVRRIEVHGAAIRTLARVDPISVQAGDPVTGAVQVVVDEATLALPLADVVDLGQERDRLRREIAKMEAEIEKVDRKLANEAFLAKAPEAVVDENRDRREEARRTLERLAAALGRLPAT